MIARMLNVLFPIAIAGSFVAVVVSSARERGEHLTVVHEPVIRSASLSGDSVIRRTFAARSGSLVDIDLKTGGEITVRGWNRDSVAVVATLDGKDCADGRVSFDEMDSGLRVRFELERNRRRSNCDADFDVQVPLRQSLKLRTMGGDISVAEVEGEIRGTTMGGSLDLTALKGFVGLTTMGGDISLTRSEVDGSVKTMGGKVLLEDVVGAVKGESMGGNVISRRVRTSANEAVSDVVRIKTMGGDIEVEDAPGGADLHTMGGKIRVRSAGKHVKAVTMGGGIDVTRLDGSIEASTMGGDIEVTMVGDPSAGDRAVELESRGGDITLVVPPGLSMNLDLEIAYTRRREGRYRIISDFDVRTSETNEWEHDDGDARRYIRGLGDIAGGRNRIKIETVNGNIYLRKGT